jgi:AdoMet-dependent rRNA methyltransferase SPB1
VRLYSDSSLSRKANSIIDRLLKHPLTTDEIKNCCEDLKVLGKKDFKTLLKYRAAIREDLGLDNKVDEKEELTERAEVEPLDEEEQITQQVRFFPFPPSLPS